MSAVLEAPAFNRQQQRFKHADRLLENELTRRGMSDVPKAVPPVLRAGWDDIRASASTAFQASKAEGAPQTAQILSRLGKPRPLVVGRYDGGDQ